jgi:hypothetical protein
MMNAHGFEFRPQKALLTRANGHNFSRCFYSQFYCSSTRFELGNNSKNPLTETMTKLCDTSGFHGSQHRYGPRIYAVTAPRRIGKYCRHFEGNFRVELDSASRILIFSTSYLQMSDTELGIFGVKES